MRRLLAVKQSQHQAGFTLLEMLVVVIMVGVLGAIAAPGWLGYLNRQRSNQVRNDIAQILQQAQSDAQQKSDTRTVTIDTTAGAPALTVSTAGTTGFSQELNPEGGATFSLTTTSSATQLSFNHQGVLEGVTTPFVIRVNGESASTEPRCVKIMTLLGAMVETEGETECDVTP